MLISELSKKTEVSIHTLRYYENLGLIQEHENEGVKTNNYKDYDESLIERMEIIKETKEVGFTLAEIKKIPENWYSDVPVEEQLKLFHAKIREVDEKIRRLEQVKKRLQQVVKELEGGEC